MTGLEVEEKYPDIISAYTRADALADGEQVDISNDAREAGFRFPVYMTRGAFAATVEAGGAWVSDGSGDGETLVLPTGQDVKGRLWDVLNVLRWAIKSSASNNEITFMASVYAYDGTDHRRDVELLSQCGPVDFDNPAPAITIMLPEEK